MNNSSWYIEAFQNLRRSVVVAVAVTLIVLAIGIMSHAQSNPTGPVLKIAVMGDGQITVNGSAATMNSLRASLKELSKQKGVVWYYREAADKTPPPEAKQVIQAVVEAGLPIRLSTRPDYSDAIGMDGKPIAASGKATDSSEPKRIPAAVAGGLLCGSASPDRAEGTKDSAGTLSKTNSENSWSPMCETVPPPLYLPAAKLARIQGTVTLKAVIGKDGTVKSLKAVEGNPMLIPAAIEAVKRWKYRPYLENGKPVEVETTIAVNFALN